MSNLMFALSAAMLAVSASAQAAQPKDQPGAPATEAATAIAPVANAQRYCVKNTLTGTRIPKKTCMTREEWMKTGFDPLKPNG